VNASVLLRKCGNHIYAKKTWTGERLTFNFDMSILVRGRFIFLTEFEALRITFLSREFPKKSPRCYHCFYSFKLTF
jgi:hypothetical protein